jgi:hypothetical protein
VESTGGMEFRRKLPARSGTKNPPGEGGFRRKLLAQGRGIRKRKGDSAGNYQLRDEESARGRGIPPEITSSGTRNPPEERGFRRKLPAQGRGIRPRKGDSAGNYQLRDEESARGRGIPPGITSLWAPIQTGKIKMREYSPVR